MALIIETGTGLADAQAYVDEAGARAYASLRGVDLPVDDSAVAALLIQATDYLEAQRAQYQGTKATTVQALQWPRSCVVIDGTEFADNAIPKELVAAQCQLVMELHAGAPIMASMTGLQIKRRKTDVLETEYMTAADTGTGTAASASFPKIDALLAPLFGGLNNFLSTYRA